MSAGMRGWLGVKRCGGGGGLNWADGCVGGSIDEVEGMGAGEGLEVGRWVWREVGGEGWG